jgi:NTE family protein
VTERSVGVNAADLLDVERTMYRMMVPSRDGYIGGSPPIFQALAQGQAAYVLLDKDPEASDHLTRLYTGLPPETLKQLGPGNDKYTPVRKALLDRLQRGDFPAFVDVDGDYGGVNATESIATESISSIARRENVLSQGFADPSGYYRWLVTRVDSAFRRTDPWLNEVKPDLHERIDGIKDNLTPPWIAQEANADPLGSIPLHQRSERAYEAVMDSAGGGKAPTLETLTDFADTAISLDRDLLFAVQTYWVKLLREIGPAQRQSLFLPLARSWVALNTIPPDDPKFGLVSPDNAPYIELIDQNAGQKPVMERYDRAMALSEVISHSLAGLGIDERRALVDTILGEIRSRRDDLADREQRIRTTLGSAYSGLDIDGLLSGRIDGRDPAVRQGLAQLAQALDDGAAFRPMTPEHAELQRHFGLLDFVANHNATYPEHALNLARKLPAQTHDPVIVSQYYQDNGLPPTPLPPGPPQMEVLGKARAGKAPLPASLVFEGGGGKGFAFIECLKQFKDGLRASNTQVGIDSYVGNSAGAITAGLLAAGYDESQLASVMQELDFKKFYADYLWLSGGVDPQVRGVERTGLFSTRQMYQSLAGLIQRKIPVTGRPVLFRDLPYKLTVTATVLNSDLPDDLKKQLGIGKDGQIVFSSENTPNMDVAAAISASASVPAFFNSPQVQIVRDEPDGQGGTRKAEYRLQLVDGGVVNNFPIAHAAEKGDAKPTLIVPPAYYQAPGNPPVTLSTLNFDPSNLAQIDAYNRKRYAEFAPHLGDLLQKAQDDGSERAIVAFKLVTPTEQPSLIVQGKTRAETEKLRGLAASAGIQTEKAKDAAAQIRKVFPKKVNYVEEKLLDEVLDRNHTLHPSLCHEPRYSPGQTEASGLSDVLIGVTAAQTVAPYHVGEKLFEQA